MPALDGMQALPHAQHLMLAHASSRSAFTAYDPCHGMYSLTRLDVRSPMHYAAMQLTNLAALPALSFLRLNATPVHVEDLALLTALHSLELVWVEDAASRGAAWHAEHMAGLR